MLSSKEAQLRRILERNRELNLDQVRDRIESQWPTEMKKDLADFIIDNSIDRKRCRVDGKDESSTEFNSHGSEEERDETSTELDKFSLRECKNILTLLQRQQPCINWQWWSLVAFPFTTVAYCVLKKFEK